MYKYDYESFRKNVNTTALLRKDSVNSLNDFFVVDLSLIHI